MHTKKINFIPNRIWLKRFLNYPKRGNKIDFLFIIYLCSR